MHINPAMWAVYKGSLEEIVLRYPSVFRGYKKGGVDYENMDFSTEDIDANYVTDAWGCEWRYPLRYMDGVVIGHPLADIAKLDSYVPPTSPAPELTAEEWAREIEEVNAEKARGNVVSGGTEHGFLFLRHTYLRGFDNAMLDYADAENHENLRRIYDMIVRYNMKLVEYHIRRGSDYMEFAEDLGTQTGTIVSPDMFRKWIKPAYAALMRPCKDAGMYVGLHSDGKTLDILEDQIEAGVDVVNPQDLCNGIDELARRIKGKACIRLDVDRQSVIPYGTPGDIDDLIREEVEKLGSPEGGLMFICGLYPPTPVENVGALAAALEKYSTMWLPRTI
jgi:uroporphyrinogen decarboxylase